MTVVIGFEMFGETLHVSLSAYPTWKSDQIEQAVASRLIQVVATEVKNMVERKVIPHAKVNVSGQLVKLMEKD